MMRYNKIKKNIPKAYAMLFLGQKTHPSSGGFKSWLLS